MKEIKAVIQPQRLNRLRDAFRAMQAFPGMTIAAVQGCSANDSGGTTPSFVGELTEFSNKVRIEIVAADDLVEEILRIIHETAHSGQKGDGLVWVSEVDTCRQLRAPLR